MIQRKTNKYGDIIFYQFGNKTYGGVIHCDGSGYIEVFDKKGNQIYCKEDGNIADKINDLNEEIKRIERLKVARDGLLKIKSKKLEF